MKQFRWCCAMLAVILASRAEAGAWLEPKGEGLFIVQGSTFASDAFYDRNGIERAQPVFGKYEVQPYVEYGWRPDITVGATAYVQRDSQSGQANIGIADPEFFLRMPLWKNDRQIFSLQPLLKLKSQFAREGTPRGGSSSTDAELSLLYGRTLNLVSPRDYLDLRGGYRYRMNGLNDQIRADAAVGLHLAPRWRVTPAVRAIAATKIPDRQTFSENGDQDYDLLKFELGVAYTFSPTQEIGATVFDHAMGRQTGNGEGVLVSYAQRF